MKKIVIVGGGAGGLELASKLGRKLGRKKKAEVVLVDKKPFHLWKPLLHEVAAGILDNTYDGLSYRAHARNQGFEFQRGELCGLDREHRRIQLAAIEDDEGKLLVPERSLEYDYLVLAIGSVSNDFGTQGVAEHACFLDSPAQAEGFNRKLMNLFLKRQAQDESVPLSIAIVGGGATGVELSAELYHALGNSREYGFERLDNHRLNVTLIEAGERILPALPERIAKAARQELTKLGAEVLEDTRIIEANEQGYTTSDGVHINADLMVWAAGIKAPAFLAELADLESNKLNQLKVRPSLQTTLDDNIFALGDCASLEIKPGLFVPPRAQAAHQMADVVADNVQAMLANRVLKHFTYKDHGSLVSLSRFSAVGSLMGGLTGGSLFVEGRLARAAYLSLYRLHLAAIHGGTRAVCHTAIELLSKAIRPKLKLH